MSASRGPHPDNGYVSPPAQPRWKERFMSEFLDHLSVYYLCDTMASIHRLGPVEALGCVEAYETVKRHFLETALAPFGTNERAEQMRRAYLEFLGWQNANAVLAADLRATAEARALALMPTALR
jgi:hypothetical protein